MVDGVDDGLALADGIAIGGDLADGDAFDGVLADGDAIEEALDDLGVDGELSSSESDEDLDETFSKRELSLLPATHSQSTTSLRPRITLALI